MKPMSQLISVCFVLLLSLLLTIPADAKTREPIPVTGTSIPSMQSFEKEFISFMQYWKIPGAAVAIVKNGRVVYSRGFGWADIQKQQPVYPNSQFRIASVSKLFTAATTLKLAQEGRLDLNAKAFAIMNDLQPINNKPVNPRIYDITVKNLLQMSSGWFSQGSGHIDPMFGPWPKYMTSLMGNTLPASCAMTARMMMSIPLRYRPGTVYAYSNLDYCMLGLIIDKVTGHNYDYVGYQDYVQNNILAPLSINSMLIGSTEPQYRAPNEVTYYREGPMSSDDLLNSFYLPYSKVEILHKNFANGGWVATAPDLAEFMYDLSHDRIINANYLQLMTSRPSYLRANRKPNKFYYAMGMGIYNIKGQIYWIQTGSFTATNSIVIRKPDGTTIAAVFNTRPSLYTFFTRYRSELRGLLISKNLVKV